MEFLVARVVRIYPAFWVCLVLTAVVFAPLAVALEGAVRGRFYPAPSPGCTW